MATAPPNHSNPDEEDFLADVEEESNEQPSEENVEEPDEFDFSAISAPSSSRPRTVVPAKPKTSIKEIAVPLLFTVGVILLIPAVWGTLVLAGSIESKREGAKGMAAAMLVCYPVALCLIGGGILFLRQVMKEKARHASVISKE